MPGDHHRSIISATMSESVPVSEQSGEGIRLCNLFRVLVSKVFFKLAIIGPQAKGHLNAVSLAGQ